MGNENNTKHHNNDRRYSPEKQSHSSRRYSCSPMKYGKTPNSYKYSPVHYGVILRDSHEQSKWIQENPSISTPDNIDDTDIYGDLEQSNDNNTSSAIVEQPLSLDLNLNPIMVSTPHSSESQQEQHGNLYDNTIDKDAKINFSPSKALDIIKDVPVNFVHYSLNAKDMVKMPSSSNWEVETPYISRSSTLIPGFSSIPKLKNVQESNEKRQSESKFKSSESKRKRRRKCFSSSSSSSSDSDDSIHNMSPNSMILNKKTILGKVLQLMEEKDKLNYQRAAILTNNSKNLPGILKENSFLSKEIDKQIFVMNNMIQTINEKMCDNVMDDRQQEFYMRSPLFQDGMININKPSSSKSTIIHQSEEIFNVIKSDANSQDDKRKSIKLEQRYRKKRREEPIIDNNWKIKNESQKRTSTEDESCQEIYRKTEDRQHHNDSRTRNKPCSDKENSPVSDVIPNIKYIDQGMHWCELCTQFLDSIHEYVEHLKSANHIYKLEKDTKMWLPKCERKIKGEINKNAPMLTTPLQGVEFMHSLVGYYCSLCDLMIKYEEEASNHAETKIHVSKYKDYLLKNPMYETTYIKEKMSAFAKYSIEKEKCKSNSVTEKTFNMQGETISPFQKNIHIGETHEIEPISCVIEKDSVVNENLHMLSNDVPKISSSTEIKEIVNHQYIVEISNDRNVPKFKVSNTSNKSVINNNLSIAEKQKIHHTNEYNNELLLENISNKFSDLPNVETPIVTNVSKIKVSNTLNKPVINNILSIPEKHKIHHTNECNNELVNVSNSQLPICLASIPLPIEKDKKILNTEKYITESKGCTKKISKTKLPNIIIRKISSFKQELIKTEDKPNLLESNSNNTEQPPKSILPRVNPGNFKYATKRESFANKPNITEVFSPMCALINETKLSNESLINKPKITEVFSPMCGLLNETKSNYQDSDIKLDLNSSFVPPQRIYTVAIFGHSYVHHLKDFNQSNLVILDNGTCKLNYFPFPNCTFETFLSNTSLLDGLVSESPDFVVVLLGGNEIKINSTLDNVKQNCHKFFNHLRVRLPNSKLIASQIDYRYGTSPNSSENTDVEKYKKLVCNYNAWLNKKKNFICLMRICGNGALSYNTLDNPDNILNRDGIRKLYRIICNTLKYIFCNNMHL